MTIDPTDPPAPLPETGHEGAPGEPAHGSRGGAGGTGGDGGRGGIGLTGPQGEPGRAGTDEVAQSLFDKWGIAIAVLVCAASAIYFAVQANGQLDDAERLIAQGAEQQQRTTDTIACQQDVTEDIAEALKARTVFAQQQAEASIVLHEAQKIYLDTVSERPPVTTASRYEALAEYQRALDFNIQAAIEAMRIRDDRPYPSQERIESCLR